MVAVPVCPRHGGNQCIYHTHSNRTPPPRQSQSAGTELGIRRFSCILPWQTGHDAVKAKNSWMSTPSTSKVHVVQLQSVHIREDITLDWRHLIHCSWSQILVVCDTSSTNQSNLYNKQSLHVSNTSFLRPTPVIGGVGVGQSWAFSLQRDLILRVSRRKKW